MGLVGLVWRCGVRALVWEAHQEGFSLDVISWDDVTLQHSFGDHFWRLHDTQWALSVPKVLIKPSQKPCGTSEEAWLTFVRINIGFPEGVSGGLLWRSPARWSLVCVFAFAIFQSSIQIAFYMSLQRSLYVCGVGCPIIHEDSMTKHSLNTDTSGPSFISYG